MAMTRNHTDFSLAELEAVVDRFNAADCDCCAPSDLDTAFDEAGFLVDEDGNPEPDMPGEALRRKLHAFAVELAYYTQSRK